MQLILIPVYADVFLNKWAVHIHGDKQEAKRIAEKHGFKSHGQVRSRLKSPEVVVGPGGGGGV